MHAFHYDYIKKECCNKAILLFPDTDSLLHKLKLKMFIMILVKVKKCLNSVFFFFFNKSKYYDGSNASVGKIKYEMGGVATEEFVGLKPKMYSFVPNRCLFSLINLPDFF